MSRAHSGSALSPELHAFATMLGGKLSRCNSDCGANHEFAEIAEFRLSQILGLPMADPGFKAAWEAVYDFACELAGDQEPEGPDPIPTETELAGMPFHDYIVDIVGPQESRLGLRLIEARTMEEAARAAEAEKIEDVQGYGVMPLSWLQRIRAGAPR